MGTDQTIRYPQASRLPFPACHSIGLMAGHLKDASGAATAAGLRPVLDLPGHKPRTGSYPETGDASHARLHTLQPPPYPSLTRPRSFRDDIDHRSEIYRRT
jgi:hypothetical protein